MVSCVSGLVSLPLPVLCRVNNAASTSVPRSSDTRQPGNLKRSITMVVCRQKKKLFFRGLRLYIASLVEVGKLFVDVVMALYEGVQKVARLFI